MPLFRRKLDAAAPADEVDETEVDEVEEVRPQPRGYTPPKGRETPKRAPAQARRRTEPAPANRREAYRRDRERRRADRAEAMEGMRRGDPRFLSPRDRGDERGLVRDIVDSRRTMGTWFFGGALLVILGSSQAMPVQVQIGANLLWVVLAGAVILDSVLIALKIKKLIRQRYPKTDQRMGSLYLYGIMRGMTFRRMRIPKPRINIGSAV